MEELTASIGTTAVGALASASSGGILGLLGSAAGAFFRERQAKEERELRKIEFEQELELQRLQIQASDAETEREAKLANLDGTWGNLEASMQAEARLTGSSDWVKDVKALFRPFLTVLLVAITAGLLFVLLTGQVDPDALYLDREAVADLVGYTVSSTVFTTSTAVAWWFGDRSMQPPARR